MAITMSGATVDSSNREALLNSEVDSSILGGGKKEERIGAGLGGYSVQPTAYGSNTKLVGITGEFAAFASEAIENYCKGIEDILSKLESEESGMAFQGPSIRGALANFVEGVRSSALSYLNKLKAAEQQIVASVFETYAAQDEDISSNLASDTSKLNS